MIVILLIFIIIFIYLILYFSVSDIITLIMMAYIKILEGNLIANIGDYIIQGIKGEFYLCKPDIFHKTYEPI